MTRSMILIIPGYQEEMCEKVSIAVPAIATHTIADPPLSSIRRRNTCKSHSLGQSAPSGYSRAIQYWNVGKKKS